MVAVIYSLFFYITNGFLYPLFLKKGNKGKLSFRFSFVLGKMNLKTRKIYILYFIENE
jgi:hypothetical protein